MDNIDVKHLGSVVEAAPKHTDPNISLTRARVYSFTGENEKALDNLERAYEKKEFLSAFVKADPIFDNLRAEPRYQAILKNMGLNEI